MDGTTWCVYIGNYLAIGKIDFSPFVVIAAYDVSKVI